MKSYHTWLLIWKLGCALVIAGLVWRIVELVVNKFMG